MADDSRVNWTVRKLQLAVQMGEPLEAEQERRGTTGTVRDWFAEKEIVWSGVRDELGAMRTRSAHGCGQGERWYA
jgi:hypothetical protein